MSAEPTHVGERFTFLSSSFASIRPPRPPANIFAIAGFPRRESVTSNVLAFFLDPSDERHGFGTVLVDALLDCIDGWPLIGEGGRASDKHLVAESLEGSSEWQVHTEFATTDRKRIDILLTNDSLGTAIVIENKVDATVINPFESYARHMRAAYVDVAVVVLAPTHRAAELEQRSLATWVSGCLTYDDLFAAYRRRGPSAAVDRRSRDLFDQLEENLSERRSKMTAQADQAMLESFWGQFRGKERDFQDFFKALHRVNQVLERRAREVLLLVESKLEPIDVIRGTFVSSGQRAAWGREDGRVAVVYAGVHLEGGVTAELVLGFLPKSRLYGLHFKAYGHGRPAERPFEDFDRLALNATLADSNEIVADEVVALILRALEAHPSR